MFECNSALNRICFKNIHILLLLRGIGRIPPQHSICQRAPVTPMPCALACVPSVVPFNASSFFFTRQYLILNRNPSILIMSCRRHPICDGHLWGLSSGRETIHAASTRPTGGGDLPLVAAVAVIFQQRARSTRIWCLCRAVPLMPAGSLTWEHAEAYRPSSLSPIKVTNEILHF